MSWHAWVQVDTTASLPPFPGAFSAHPVADASVYAAISAAEAAAFASTATGDTNLCLTLELSIG